MIIGPLAQQREFDPRPSPILLVSMIFLALLTILVKVRRLGSVFSPHHPHDAISGLVDLQSRKDVAEPSSDHRLHPARPRRRGRPHRLRRPDARKRNLNRRIREAQMVDPPFARSRHCVQRHRHCESTGFPVDTALFRIPIVRPFSSAVHLVRIRLTKSPRYSTVSVIDKAMLWTIRTSFTSLHLIPKSFS